MWIWNHARAVSSFNKLCAVLQRDNSISSTITACVCISWTKTQVVTHIIRPFLYFFFNLKSRGMNFEITTVYARIKLCWLQCRARAETGDWWWLTRMRAKEGGNENFAYGNHLIIHSLLLSWWETCTHQGIFLFLALSVSINFEGRKKKEGNL
jgi:hypothetical protein